MGGPRSQSELTKNEGMSSEERCGLESLELVTFLETDTMSREVGVPQT